MTAFILYLSITFRLRLPPRQIFLKNFERPFTLRTRLAQPSKFVKTRFRRFATFDFSAPNKIFREIFLIEKSVFYNFGQVFEEQRPNGH